jgi:hypothetical protein
MVDGRTPLPRFIRGPLVPVLAYKSLQPFHVWSCRARLAALYRTICIGCGLVIGVLSPMRSRVSRPEL